MKIVPPIILKFLYLLVHLIYTWYEFIIDWISIIRLNKIFKSQVSDGGHYQVECLMDMSRKLKIPLSISFVVSREELDHEHFELLVSKLAKLVHWSVALSIRHISIFDETGKYHHYVDH